MRPQRIHNLRGNAVERSPHRLFVWDVESHQQEDGRRQLHTPRCWAAEVVLRHEKRPRDPRVAPAFGTAVAGLTDALEAACKSDVTTWAFAHNQSFDLAVTGLPLRLLERGWVMSRHALTSDSPWARMSRGSRRLVLADSTSWLPEPLAGIGVKVGIEKPPLPDDLDPEEAFAWRCRQDVRILAEALTQLLDWWDRARLGSWSTTGPQTGFNAMRHRRSPHVVVIDPDPGGRAFERQAIMSGRREVWRVGRQPWGDYRELDFKAAHATIAAHRPLPKRRGARFDRMDPDDWRIGSDRWGPIAWATIRTTTPRYPLSHAGRLFYPVGRFRTVLCGPELAEARRRQELLEVGPGYVYQLGSHMGEWGRWVLDQLDHPQDQVPEVARTAIKSWSRRVPGKWAGRTSRLFLDGVGPGRHWHLEYGRHHPSGAPCAVLDMGGRRQVWLRDQDADDCFPAVLAWIQSEVRVRLGRLVDMVGTGRMVSCNTDGLFCEHPTQVTLDLDQDELAPLRVREKQRLPWLDVISPQHLILPQEKRLSGVPVNAEEVGPYQYRWHTWPRLPSQMASGDPRGYVREVRTVDLSRVPVNRWRWRDGLCTPVQAELGEDGTTYLVPMQGDLLDDIDPGFRAAQHPALQALLAPA